MDRVETYVGQSVYEWLFSKQAQNDMVGLAKLSAAMLGTSTICNGLSCVPTGPASMQVVINPGELYQLTSLEATVCGTLPQDTAHQVVKQGILLDAFTTANGALAAPSTSGQSINYLIEAQYADSDVSIDPTTGTSPVVLQFYNSSNPTSPWSGPGGLGGTSNTFRKGAVSLQIKAGAAATTGSQVTPTPDAGWVGLWVVTVANGQSTITAGNITQYAGAPILPSSLLASIQNGNLSYAVATGTANAHVVALTPALQQRVDGMVIRYKAPAANTGSVTLTDGVGTANVIGGNHSALQGGEYIANGDAWVIWNSTVNGGTYILLECTGGALQIAPATQSQHAVQLGQLAAGTTNIGNRAVYASNGSFVVPANVTTVWTSGVPGGGGGGGSGGVSSVTSGSSASGGGGGGGVGQIALKHPLTVTPGQTLTITVGAGGAGGAAGVVGGTGGTGGAGGTSSITGTGVSYSLTGGAGGAGGGPATGNFVGGAGGAGGAGAGDGGYGIAPSGYGYAFAGSGGSGAATPYGPGGGAPNQNNSAHAGVGLGSGGSGASGVLSSSSGPGNVGGSGVSGVWVLEW